MMRMLSKITSLASSCLLLSFQGSKATLIDLIVNTEDLSTLETAVVTAGLVDVLSSPGPFTVFAPLDSAFATLAVGAPGFADALLNDPGFLFHLQNILLYHVVAAESAIFARNITDGTTQVTMTNGETLTVTKSDGTISLAPAYGGGSATVLMVDLAETNGVAHAINAVLLPAFVFSSIFDVAVSASPEFTILVNLVVTADLVDLLTNTLGLTVFAPTNDAFEMLDAETVNYLTSPEGAGALTNTLLYHVVPQSIPLGATPIGRTFLRTLLEDTQVLVANWPETTWVNAAKVIAFNVLANNGVIHAIDKVLLPPELRAPGTKGKGRNIYKGKGKGYWKGKGKGYWKGAKGGYYYGKSGKSKMGYW